MSKSKSKSKSKNLNICIIIGIILLVIGIGISIYVFVTSKESFESSLPYCNMNLANCKKFAKNNKKTLIDLKKHKVYQQQFKKGCSSLGDRHIVYNQSTPKRTSPRGKCNSETLCDAKKNCFEIRPGVPHCRYDTSVTGNFWCYVKANNNCNIKGSPKDFKNGDGGKWVDNLQNCVDTEKIKEAVAYLKKNNIPNTPQELEKASANNQYHIIKKLVEANVPFRGYGKSDTLGEAAIKNAIKNNQPETVELLLKLWLWR